LTLSIDKLNSHVKLNTVVLVIFLLLISLVLKNSELSIGAIVGGIAGLLISNLGQIYNNVSQSFNWNFDIKKLFDFCINGSDFATGQYSHRSSF